MRSLQIFLCLFLGSSAAAADGYDAYGGNLALPGDKTGWFHVQEINGRWFFVTPEGHAFFALGATHANACISKDELGIFESKFQKSEERLSESILAHFKEWGYNSAGYGALEPMEKRLPYTAVLWIKGPMSLAAGTNTAFADVFDPVVQEWIGETIRKGVARHRENRNCLGYYFLDVPTWHNSFNRTKTSGSYVDFIRALDATEPGRKAYAEFLASRYEHDLAKWNEAYGIAAKSFDDPAAMSDITAKAEKNSSILEDDEQFLNQIADQYFRVATTEARKADPNHLLLGDRFMAASAKTHDSILKTAAKYLDVISFQPMGTKTLGGDYIDHVHAITGKPVLFGDVNCVPERPAKGLTDTAAYERAVGEHTREYYMDAASRKSLIGIHRCTIQDFRPWDMTFFRTGLLKADGTPYPLLAEYTRKVSEQVFEMVYSVPEQKAP